MDLDKTIGEYYGKYKIFDTHSHYNDEVYSEDLDQVLNKCFESGVDKIINVGYNIENSKKSIEIAKKYKQIYSTVGIHPYMAIGDSKKDISQIEDLLKEGIEKYKIMAIGEIGLDYHYDNIDKELQKKYFIEQIDLAKKYSLPVVIHSRDAGQDMYDIIKEEKNMNGRILFHCFEPNEQIAKLVIDRGYMIALGGNITYKRKESSLDIIKSIPIDQIVLETDCPYLSPEPNRGKRNDSSNIIYIIDKLAEIKEIDSLELSKIVYNNSVKFFNIK